MPKVSVSWSEIEAFAGTELATRIALGCAGCAVVVSVVHAGLHLHHYTHKSVQRYAVRILMVVAVYAVGSGLSLVYPEHALYFATVRDLYEAWILFCFLSLLIQYGGGDSAIVLAMRATPGTISHPAPLCMLAPINVGASTFLRRVKQAVIQFVITKPTMAVVSLVMLLLDMYDSFAYQLLLATIYNVSFTYALYYLYLFYLGTRSHIKRHHPIRKFVAVKAVIFATYWQGLAVATLPLPREDAEAWNNFILCVEMLLFAIIHCFAFSYREFKPRPDPSPDAERPTPVSSSTLAPATSTTRTRDRGGSADSFMSSLSASSTLEDLLIANELENMCCCCKWFCCCCPSYGTRIGSAFLDVFCIGDAIRDTYHSFNPTYQTYMLQSQEVNSRFVSAVLLDGTLSGSGSGSTSQSVDEAAEAGAEAEAGVAGVPMGEIAFPVNFPPIVDEGEGVGLGTVGADADPDADMGADADADTDSEGT